MKWRGWLCSLLFVLLGLSVGGVIINQKNNTFAIQDLSDTITFSGGIPSQVFICEGNTCSSDYTYLIIQLSSDAASSLSNNSTFSFASHRYTGQSLDNVTVSAKSFVSIYNISYFYNSPYFYKISLFSSTGNFSPSSGTLTWTLSENMPSLGSPSGSLSITENGTYDVTNYAEAVVDVPVPEPEVIPGDYHDDLVSINNAILIVPAVALVVYFFYAIYKMLLGGKPL